MEINHLKPALPVRPWFKRRWVWLAFGVLLAALAWGGNKLFKDSTMPPPLVFLIPADYFGPVFFFFGQPDGVDVQPDPLGQAVKIPANGILKIKALADDVMGRSREGYRATYMVQLTKDGKRKVLKMYGGGTRDETGKIIEYYFDENSKLFKFPPADEKSGQHPFYYFSGLERDEAMVFSHGGCAHQEFYPTGDTKAKPPACGKFLLVSPNQYLKLPDFMWEEFAHSFSSIDDLIKQANEALAQKKVFYKLP
jgi:hypothetical protein